MTLADEHLEAHAEALRGRYELYQQLCNRISGEWGGWDAMTSGFTHFGVQPCTVQAGCLPPGGSVPVPELTTGQVYREWAPCAKAVSLVGDFNAWDPHAHPCTVDAFGTWTAWLPPRPDGTPLVPHLAYMKAAVVLASSSAVPSQGDAGAGDGGAPPTPPSVHFAPSAFVHRMPAWARYAELDKAVSAYCARHWNPAQSYSWQHARPLQEALRTGGVEALSDVTDVGAGHRPAHVHVSLPAHCAAPAPSTAAAARLELLKHTQPPKHIETALQAFTQGWGSTAGETAPVDVRHSAGSLRVYECHVGLCCEDERVGSYAEFTANVLPRIAAGGYTAIQLMGVMEHAYYASFGYHVTSFHAVASRSGTPDDFKALVDTAHGLGLSVIIDCVHSHASKNTEDGLNNWDGSGHQYFHEGPRGMHAQWDSRLFNYEQPEVLRFLLSNLRWWLQEYNVDGFRFDGVTSMMYTHHGIGVGFSGDYTEYFGPHADTAAQAYLMLANTLCKAL
ncbi:be1, partial [Symbiodinium sp. KB8]